MEDINVIADVLIKGGQLVRKDKIDMLKRCVIEPYADLNNFVDVEIGLALMEASREGQIDDGIIEKILEEIMRKTYSREVWRTQTLDSVIVYASSVLYGLGEKDLANALHAYMTNGKSKELYEKLIPELETLRRR